MVVIDREDYRDMAKQLLADNNTYQPITKDPTNRLKNKLSHTLRDIKNEGGHYELFTGKCTPPAWLPLNFMAYPKIQKICTPSGPLSPVGVYHIWSGQGAS